MENILIKNISGSPLYGAWKSVIYYYYYRISITMKAYLSNYFQRWNTNDYVLVYKFSINIVMPLWLHYSKDNFKVVLLHSL